MIQVGIAHSKMKPKPQCSRFIADEYKSINESIYRTRSNYNDHTYSSPKPSSTEIKAEDSGTLGIGERFIKSSQRARLRGLPLELVWSNRRYSASVILVCQCRDNLYGKNKAETNFSKYSQVELLRRVGING
jgi:hypothetical protein